MPRPSNTTAIQRPDLGMAVQETIENAPHAGFIGLEVMPIMEVPKQSATYPVIPMEALIGIENTDRAMRGTYNRGDWDFEEGFYSTKEQGWEEPLDDRERNLYKDKLDAELIATDRATNIVLRSQEKRIADKVFNPTVFTPTAVDNEWDDAENATPIDDVKKGKKAVRSKCGMLPDTMIISYSTLEDLRRTAQIIELLKYTFPGVDINSMTAAQLARIFDIERVLVGGAIYNSAKKGQNAAVADLWDNEYSMLTITSGATDLSAPCIGRTFLWTEESPDNTVVEEYRSEDNRSDIYRVRHDTDERLIRSFDENDAVQSDIAANVSYLMSNISTPA